MASMLDIRTLNDGGQQAEEVMGWIVDFVDAAERSLDFAHYDLHLGPACAEPLRRSVRAAAESTLPSASSTTSTTGTRSRCRAAGARRQADRVVRCARARDRRRPD